MHSPKKTKKLKTTEQQTLRFSGHDTFHCKEQWILKGIQVIDSEKNKDIFKSNDAIPLLGVGKNMVRSIHYWLKSFAIFDKDNTITEFADILFLRKGGLDPFLENEGSLWLLQYNLCKTEHSSIFKIIFSSYFLDKAALEFSEFQIYNYVNRLLKEIEQKELAEKTFNSDFKVFIRTYVAPTKNEKTIEDDFNTPLISLNLIADTGRKNSLNQPVYRLKRDVQNSITNEIFAYCLLDEFEEENAVNYDQIKKTVGSYLCLSNEGIDNLIDNLCNDYSEFVYKDDAGVRQLQIKNNTKEFKFNLLNKHYELQQ